MCSLQQEILITHEIHDGEGQTIEQDQVYEGKLRFQGLAKSTYINICFLTEDLL